MTETSKVEQLQVSLKTASGKSKEGQILLKVFTKNERIKRTLVTLFGFWFLSVMCILIPVLHFVLVPTFFLLAPYLAMQKWHQDATIVGGECLCPECSEKLALGSLSAKWPLILNCMNCKSRVHVDKIKS